MMVLWWLRGSRGAGRSESEPQAILLVLWVVAHGGSSGMVELGSLHGRWFGHRAWRRSRARVRLRFLTSPTSTANLLLNCFPDPPPSLLPNSLLTPIPPLCMPYAAATAPFTACCCCGIPTSHRIQPPQTSSNKALHVKTRAGDSTTTALCSRRKNTKENKWPKKKKKTMMVMKFFGRCSGREATKHKPRILGMCCRFTVCGWKKGESKKARAQSLNEWKKSEKQARELLLRLYF